MCWQEVKRQERRRRQADALERNAQYAAAVAADLASGGRGRGASIPVPTEPPTEPGTEPGTPANPGRNNGF
jgi:hypothetical protein